jgi:hypothetical protein
MAGDRRTCYSFFRFNTVARYPFRPLGILHSEFSISHPPHPASPPAIRILIRHQPRHATLGLG